MIMPFAVCGRLLHADFGQCRNHSATTSLLEVSRTLNSRLLSDTLVSR